VSEWEHGFFVGGVLGVIWGVMVFVAIWLGAVGTARERRELGDDGDREPLELPDNVVRFGKRKKSWTRLAKWI